MLEAARVEGEAHQASEAVGALRKRCEELQKVWTPVQASVQV